MRCCRFFSSIFLVMAMIWLTAPTIDAQTTFNAFNDNDVNPAKVKQELLDRDDFIIASNTDDPCTNALEAYSESDGGWYAYTFWEPVFVHSGDSTSRCVVLKDLPFTGYYRVKVVAMYTKDNQETQNREEYRLAVASTDSFIIDPTPVRDQNSDTTTGITPPTFKNLKIKDGYEYYEIDHGFRRFTKGDNLIRFYTGGQYTGGGNINSVDFYGIKLYPPPFINPEPRVTAGYSNTIEFLPIEEGAIRNEVVYVDETGAQGAPRPNQSLGKSSTEDWNSRTISGLEHDHTYSYYVKAETTDGKIVSSETTHSTQDALPPNRVEVRVRSFGNKRIELQWQPAIDQGQAGVEYYNVIRSENNGTGKQYSVVAIIPDSATYKTDDGLFFYADCIDEPNALDFDFTYRIDAVDSVGNKSTGLESKIVDGIPAPTLSIPNAVADSFYYGAKITVVADVSNLLLPGSHKILFQAARDDTANFSRNVDNNYLFESGLIQLTDASTVVPFEFDLTNGGTIEKSLIDGHTYFFRARLVDQQENYSDWSYDDNPLFVIPDCFPPNDISFLNIEATTDSDNTEGWMALSWGGAADKTSGIDSFIVYRKIQNVDATFKEIKRVRSTSYKDSFAAINFNGNVTYKIGSVDRVGNERTADNSNFEATARSQSAPVVSFIPAQDVDSLSPEGVLYTVRNAAWIYATVGGADDSTFKKLVIKMNQEPEKDLVADDRLPNRFRIPLPEIEKAYTIKLRALFSDKSTSLWSRPLTVVYSSSLPDGPSLLTQNEMEEMQVSNFPNPFNMTTRIHYVLQKDSHVSIEVYNIQGRKIRTLMNGQQGNGRHTILWHGENDNGKIVSSGIYYYTITIEDSDGKRMSRTQKMLLVK